jgi:predicted membrane chloride channel (bestrophin family)
LNLYADFPLTLVGLAIVFPIVFSINSAYKRRERALLSLAEITGYALGIYQSAKNLVDDFSEEDNERVQGKIVELFSAIKNFLQSPREGAKELEIVIYQKLDEISKEIRYLRDQGLAGRFASRLNQYLTRMTVAIDSMKVIFYYRTPRTLRAYSKIFIFSFPIIYAPYFASVASAYAFGLGYVMPVLFSFILISLDNIQEHLEDPYDQIGEDDVKMDIDDIEIMIGKK